MFEMIKSKAWQLSSALLLMLCISLAAVLLFARHDLANANDAAQRAQAGNQVLTTDNQRLAGAIAGLNADNAKLISERDRLAEQIKAAEVAKAAKSSQFKQLQDQMTAMLQGAADEHTTAWRHDYVPDDVARVLVTAASCANSSGKQNSVCQSATGTDNAMLGFAHSSKSTALYRERQNPMPHEPGIISMGATAFERPRQL